MELILDASSASSLAGFARNGKLEWCSPLLAPQQHTREMLPAIASGLHSVSSTYGDIQMIVVALGPGPFNGLRVAVSTAKGIATGTGAALVGIPTLHAEAQRCPTTAEVIRCIILAGRSGFATAEFACRDGSWIQTRETVILDVRELPHVLDPLVPLCGDLDALAAAGLPEALRARLLPATVNKSRLEALAELGWCRYVSGEVVPAASLQPLYVRSPHITVPRERRP